jgi:predicted transcriptional regulator
MRKKWNIRNKSAESAVCDILKSRARSRIYIFLLRKGKAKTDQIIKGSKLHPSTVRETLSKMYDQNLINRKKIRNDSIGKNPYVYYAIPPIKLLKRYAEDIEDKFNKIANLDSSLSKTKRYRPIKIKIYERGGDS